MSRKSIAPLIWLIILILVTGAACGSPAKDTPAPPTEAVKTEVPETAAPPVSTEVPEPTAGAISSLQDVKKAVIQIEAQGTFIDPEFGLVLNGAGRGSGFIIDPAGIAVTNNHVVSGAALLKVWVGGETEPRNARVLGVSECSDLAVIDIEGDGYEFLEWHAGSIDVGMDMYIAGFPLGDPEYTLTKGVISKAKADGETGWASVDSVVEYDATSNPGNSGGPVVTPDGKVLAVHYAGNANTRQAFGISKEIAGGVVEQLRFFNLDSIGVNGQAVGNEDGSLTGVWVSSVQSGSPADKAGVEPGDIITMLENLVLATDGTMADYCDILRSHKSSDTLSLEVLRWASGEVLQGQLNGDELAVVAVFGETNENTNANDNTSASTDVVNPNASQSGDFYFYTEFDGDLSSWVYFLTNGKEEDFTAETAGSRMRIEIDETYTYVYFLYNDYSYTDTRIDLNAENLGRNNNNVSLICRESDLGWYEFNIANNGTYNIYWYDDVTRDDYVELFSGGSTAIKMGHDINEYTVWCVGDQLSLMINGVEVRTVTDKNLKDGRTGLSVSSFNVTPIIVDFDYFIVSVP